MLLDFGYLSSSFCDSLVFRPCSSAKSMVNNNICTLSCWFICFLLLQSQDTKSSSAKVAKELLNGKKIAFAITVTKDGPYLDGAAVLVQSIIATNSRYQADIVAIVHPGVQTTRQALKDIGFRVIEFEPPVYANQIEGIQFFTIQYLDFNLFVHSFR